MKFYEASKCRTLKGGKGGGRDWISVRIGVRMGFILLRYIPVETPRVLIVGCLVII